MNIELVTSPFCELPSWQGVGATRGSWVKKMSKFWMLLQALIIITFWHRMYCASSSNTKCDKRNSWRCDTTPEDECTSNILKQIIMIHAVYLSSNCPGEIVSKMSHSLGPAVDSCATPPSRVWPAWTAVKDRAAESMTELLGKGTCIITDTWYTWCVSTRATWINCIENVWFDDWNECMYEKSVSL